MFLSMCADLTSSVPQALLPHKKPALDNKQGISPAQHNLGAVFINSVSLADPLNTLPLPVAIVSSMVPPVYAEMKKKQAKELADEIGQVGVGLAEGFASRSKGD